MRKTFCVLVFLIFTMVLGSIVDLSVQANEPAVPTDYNCYYYGFDGRANRKRAIVSSVVDKETYSPSGIEWDYSSLKGLNMFFSIHNSRTGKEQREVLFMNHDSGCFTITNTNTKRGTQYDLRARRQNIWIVGILKFRDLGDRKTLK